MNIRKASFVGVASLVVPVGVAAVADSPSAFADTGMTLSVGSPTLTSRLLLSVPVTIVCSPTSDPTLSDYLSVSIQQAYGRTVSTGSATMGGGPFSVYGGNPFLNCDGVTSNQITVNVLPDRGSRPFHGGAAIITVDASHSAGTCEFFSCQVTGSDDAEVGPSSITIKG